MTAPAALRHPLFVRVWAGGVVSAVGTQMSNVAKAWMLYTLTGSAAALGVEGLCFSVPIMVLPLVTGPLTDRLDRAALLRATMAAEAGLGALLAGAAVAGQVRPWLLYLTAALEAARLALDIPARSALVATLVPGAALASAQSLSSTVYSASALVGPALGGLLLAAGGAGTVFAVNAASCVVALGAFRPVGACRAATATGPDRVAVPAGAERADPPADTHPIATPADPSRPDLPAGPPPRLFDGLRFAAHRPELLRLQAVLFTTGALAIGIETLLPVLDRTRWSGGAVGYGLLRAAPGLAAVAAGVRLSTRPAARSPHRALAGAVLTACAALAAVPLAPRLGWAFGLLAAGSAALSAAQVHALTRIQRTTPDRIRGAIGGITAITQSGLAGVAAAGMALVAAHAGATPVIITVAALTALVGAAAGIGGRPPPLRTVGARTSHHLPPGRQRP